MTRAEVWEKFKMDHIDETEQMKRNFWKNLQERIGRLMECIYEAFEKIGELATEQKKNNCVYFLYSLQRYDLTQGKAIVRLDVTNLEWYLDEAPLTSCFDITFLFQEYFDFQKRLLLDMREYRGKINAYDIGDFIQNEIMICNKAVAHILRFAFRDLEKQEIFNQIGKMHFWVIRWGEYKDESEVVIQINREIKEEKIWQEKLEKYEKNQNIFIAEHWYKGEIGSGNCQNKNMYFMFFEECILKNIDFSGADLTGTRFLKCQIVNCNFSRAILDQADFNNSSFLNNQFQDTSLNQTTFSEEGFLPELFSEKQLKELLVVCNKKTEQND